MNTQIENNQAPCCADCCESSCCDGDQTGDACNCRRRKFSASDLWRIQRQRRPVSIGVNFTVG